MVTQLLITGHFSSGEPGLWCVQEPRSKDSPDEQANLPVPKPTERASSRLQTPITWLQPHMALRRPRSQSPIVQLPTTSLPTVLGKEPQTPQPWAILAVPSPPGDLHWAQRRGRVGQGGREQLPVKTRVSTAEQDRAGLQRLPGPQTRYCQRPEPWLQGAVSTVMKRNQHSVFKFPNVWAQRQFL